MNARIRVIHVHRLKNRSSGDEDPVATPAGRLSVMWQLTLDAWAFKGDLVAEPRLLRHVVHIGSVEGVEFEEAWPNRKEVKLEGLRVPVIGREDLVRNKRALGRPQDLVDVARLEEGDVESGQ